MGASNKKNKRKKSVNSLELKIMKVNHSSIHFLSFSIYMYVLLSYVTITMSCTCLSGE